MSWWFGGIIVATVALDLLTKFTIPGILNPGISFGLGASFAWLWYVIVAASFVLVGLGIYWFVRSKDRSWVFVVGLALLLGGILGNAIDRLCTAGQVHDFIDFIWFKNNLADIAIFIGAVLVGGRLAFR